MADQPSEHGKVPDAEQPSGGVPWLWLAVIAAAVVAIFGAYQLLAASTGSAESCCSSTAQIKSPDVTGTAQVQGGVQRLSVAVSATSYNPNVIVLKSGVPAEITFSGGEGCTADVHSDALGFSENMTRGPVTVKLEDPKTGTYPVACGMNMVYGRIVVR